MGLYALNEALEDLLARQVKSLKQVFNVRPAHYPEPEDREPGRIYFSNARLTEALEAVLSCGHVLTYVRHEGIQLALGSKAPCLACGPRKVQP